MDQAERARLLSALESLRVADIREVIQRLNDELHAGIRKTATRKREMAERIVNYMNTLLFGGNIELVTQTNTILNDYIRNYRANVAVNLHGNVRTVPKPAPPLPRASIFNAVNPTYPSSPFYTIVARLGDAKTIPACPDSRLTKVFQFQLKPEQIALLQEKYQGDNERLYQIRFFCALPPAYSTSATQPSRSQPVEFPTSCELRINHRHIIANTKLRGIKGRPNTVHPAEVTQHLALDQSRNMVEFIYANTLRSYVASVELVKRQPVPHLVNRLTRDRVVAKEEVMKRMLERSLDTDLVIESETISTKCPLGFTRIETPGRARQCAHLQCFDVTTFLLMNEQTPTWNCPICSRIMTWDDLVIDEYFASILKRVGNVESMQVDVHGNLKILETGSDDDGSETDDETAVKPVKAEPKDDGGLANGQQGTSNDLITILDDDDDDENDDRNDARQPRRRKSIPNSSATNASSPRSRPSSSTMANSSVVDLTLSSDDENDTENANGSAHDPWTNHGYLTDKSAYDQNDARAANVDRTNHNITSNGPFNARAPFTLPAPTSYSNPSPTSTAAPPLTMRPYLGTPSSRVLPSTVASPNSRTLPPPTASAAKRRRSSASYRAAANRTQNQTDDRPLIRLPWPPRSSPSDSSSPILHVPGAQPSPTHPS
ncbi:PINIT domain-containing protein [Gongronella butleri]|nr:PINIT domain-containing protein [Gongronella butleri]